VPLSAVSVVQNTLKIRWRLVVTG